MHSSDHSTKGTPSPRHYPKRQHQPGFDCLSVRGFRASFIPLTGCFSPFPHGTRALSVGRGIVPWRVVPPASHQIPRVWWYSGSPTRRGHRRLRGSHPLRLAVPGDSADMTHPVGPTSCDMGVGPYNPDRPHKGARRFGLFPVRSPLLRESRLIPLPRGTEMFQFPRCPARAYRFSAHCSRSPVSGLPHSDSDGSSLACSSPSTFRRSPRPSSAPAT